MKHYIKRGTALADLPAPFVDLLKRLRAFKVQGWETDSDGPLWPRLSEEADEPADADVVSSELKATCGECGRRTESKTPLADVWRPSDTGQRHLLLLDIDHPTWLVESSTEGHFHLLVDVRGGISHTAYVALLGALRDAGVIQKGYERASHERGHSDLRMPWVSKDEVHAKADGRPPAPFPPLQFAVKGSDLVSTIKRHRRDRGL